MKYFLTKEKEQKVLHMLKSNKIIEKLGSLMHLDKNSYDET